MLISPEDCATSISKCEKFFTILDWLASSVESSLGQAQTNNQKTDATTLENFNNKIQTFSPPDELIKAFKEYHDNKSDNVESVVKSAKVCSMLVNIRKKPYSFVMDAKNILKMKHYMLDKIWDEHKEKTDELRKERKTALKPHLKERNRKVYQALKEFKKKHGNILALGINKAWKHIRNLIQRVQKRNFSDCQKFQRKEKGDSGGTDQKAKSHIR